MKKKSHKKEKFIFIFLRRFIPALLIAIILSLIADEFILTKATSIYYKKHTEMVNKYIDRIKDTYKTDADETNPNQVKLSLAIIAEIINDVHSDSFALVTDADGNVVEDSSREVLLLYRDKTNNDPSNIATVYSCDVDVFENIDIYDSLKAEFLADDSIGLVEYLNILETVPGLKIDNAYINDNTFTFLPIECHEEYYTDDYTANNFKTYQFDYSESELDGYELADPDKIRMTICMGTPENSTLKDSIIDLLKGQHGESYTTASFNPGTISYGYADDVYDSDNNYYAIYCYATTPNTIRYLGFAYAIADFIIILIAFLISLISSIRTNRKNQYFYKMEEYRKTLMDSMAHDLKTPLMAMSGYAENLKANIQTEKREHYADAIYENVQYMNEIITNVMELSKLESINTDLNPEKCDLVAILLELKDKYNPLIEQKNISFTITGSFLQKVDKKLITQALENILTNAVKYCNEGGSIEVYGDSNNLIIKNTMANPLTLDADKLWEPFVKDDSSRTNKSGSGIGLAIVKNILEYNKLLGFINTKDNWFEIKIHK